MFNSENLASFLPVACTACRLWRKAQFHNTQIKYLHLAIANCCFTYTAEIGNESEVLLFTMSQVVVAESTADSNMSVEEFNG